MKLVLAFLIFFPPPIFALSNVTAVINSKNQMVINIVDSSQSRPYEAAEIWELMAGSESTKRIKNSNFSIVCATTVSEPTRERFGTCRLIFETDSISHELGYYGAIFNDHDILKQLNPGNLVLAQGDLIVEVDKNRQAFGLRINEDRVSAESSINVQP